MPNRVGHFEIHVDDMERAVAFYRGVFGWDIQKWDGDAFEYWMISTGKSDEPGGINGGFVQRPCPAPAQPHGLTAYCCTVVVDDYDAIAQRILAHGGKEAMPKVALVGMAWQGYFLDTEGNTFGLHQADINAK